MSAQVFTGCLLLFAAPQDGAPQAAQLDEVMANVRAQPLGSGTVDDLALPEDLLRRLSDRILRRSFEDTFRIVVAAPAPGAASATPELEAGTAPPSTSPFRTILNLLALLALGVLTFLGYFAWRARSRRKE